MEVLFLVSLLGLFSTNTLANVPDSFTQNNVSYQTFFGECPSKSSGLFTLAVMKEFEKSRSLKDVKERIVSEKWDEKYFLSDYRINYNPLIKTLKIQMDCPEALAKVQIYKSNGEEHYAAILGANARLYEPQYENLIKAEKKLSFNLPLLVMSTEQLEGNAPTMLADFIKKIEPLLRRQISEIIMNKNGELTIVFSLGGKATSVFMGSDFWNEKQEKLSKVVGYMTKSKRYPVSINLTNPKKVVVKFSDKI